MAHQAFAMLGAAIPAWFPYVQAAGVAASAIAVLVAIFVPTRIQRRALLHDRQSRTNDDARKALANALLTHEEFESVIRTLARQVHSRHQLTQAASQHVRLDPLAADILENQDFDAFEP